MIAAVVWFDATQKELMYNFICDRLDEDKFLVHLPYDFEGGWMVVLETKKEKE